MVETMHSPNRRSLNRTFYGIETHQQHIVHELACCLNRTFYGIETVGLIT